MVTENTLSMVVWDLGRLVKWKHLSGQSQRIASRAYVGKTQSMVLSFTEFNQALKCSEHSGRVLISDDIRTEMKPNHYELVPSFTEWTYRCWLSWVGKYRVVSMESPIPRPCTHCILMASRPKPAPRLLGIPGHTWILADPAEVCSRYAPHNHLGFWTRPCYLSIRNL
jgi:hypothetical protein